MLQAKSMYFGGDIVSAKECNYNSYAELGLKCPFCNSAVFLRTASHRVINSVEKPISAYFAHYPSGSDDNWDCEARAKTIGGDREIGQIKIEAKKQRLKIYNAKLWEILAVNIGISRQHMQIIRKQVGDRKIEKVTKAIQIEIAKSLDKLCHEMDEMSQWISSRDPRYLKMISKLEHDVQAVFLQNSEYLSQCNQRLHTAICREVLEFLGTNSGKWALSKLAALSIYTQVIDLEKPKLNRSMRIDDLTNYQFALSTAYYLIRTHWAKEISKLNNQIALKC